MRRSACALHKRRQEKFINAILDHDNSDRAIACHLGIGTGARPDTICHIHASWFEYTENGALRLKIPASDPCRKKGSYEPCGDCNLAGHTEYAPKTPAGEGRELLISNTWKNDVTDEKEYFGLRDAVESYFALTGPNAPDGVQHGNQMIWGNGINKSTLNRWVRDIGAKSSIRSSKRETQLEKNNKVNNDNIVDFGVDKAGNDIPDLFSHDMRACYCTQLMRNDIKPKKATSKTGHENPKTLFRYADFANDEISAEEEEEFF